MKYAVIQTGGKQYKVSVGQTIEVEKLEGKDGSALSFDQVLFLADEGSFKLGNPHISGLSVAGKIVEQTKGDKIRVSKFKAKSRYRRVMGHRQKLTKVEIVKIGDSLDKKTSAKPAADIKSKKSNSKNTKKTEGK